MALVTKFWSLDGLILLLFLAIVAYVYMTRNFNYWKKRNVPEIQPEPFFGSVKDIILQRKNTGLFFRDCYFKYAPSPYVGFYILDKSFLLIRDPAIVKHILIKDCNNFLDKHFSANENDTLSRANLFLIKNPKWKYLRSKLTPVYTSGKLKKMFELMLNVCADLRTFLESQKLEGSGKVVEIKELTTSFTTDLIATTGYGLKVNSLNNPDAEFRKNTRKIFHFTTSRGYEFFAMFFAPQLLKPLNIQFFEKNGTKFLRHALWSILQEREKSGVKRPDLIDLLIELRKNQSEEEKKLFDFDGDNLVAQAAVFFTGGYETSSLVLSFALYQLAVNPDIQDKLRDEITAALQESGGNVTYDMVTSQMPYLDMVMAETLRWYPPLAFIDRVAKEDYQIPDHDLIIEKGTPVIIPMLGLHFDEEYFPNPFQFNPENFSGENKKARKSCVYLPFGEGPHTCIGMRLGSIQSKLGLITIIPEYEVLPCKETVIPVRLNPKSVFSTPDGEILLKLRKIIK